MKETDILGTSFQLGSVFSYFESMSMYGVENILNMTLRGEYRIFWVIKTDLFGSCRLLLL